MKIYETEVSTGNAGGKAGIASIPFDRGFYQVKNDNSFGVSFTPREEPRFTSYKDMKHSKKNLRRKMKKFSQYKEDATATMGNSGGMGPVVAAQPSSTPGDVAGSTRGSGDIGQVFGTYMKTPAGQTFISPKTVRGKRKKDKKMKNVQSFVNFNPMRESTEEIDNYTARWYDNYDDEDLKKPEEISLNDFSKDNLRRIQMFEEFNKEIKDYVTYEMSGSPKPYWQYKENFERDMLKWGYHHTTLTKNTDMLVISSNEWESTKTKKAQKYGIPVYTYKEAFDRKEKLYNRVIRKKRLENIEKNKED